MANFGVAPSPQPLSDKPLYVMWPGGIYTGPKALTKGGSKPKTRKASKKSRKSKRKSRRY
jgi:hypothetical protein